MLGLKDSSKCSQIVAQLKSSIINVLKNRVQYQELITGADPEFGKGGVKTRSRVGEGSCNITMKLNYIIIIPIYSFTDKLHCLINTATALLELLTALLEYLDRL